MEIAENAASLDEVLSLLENENINASKEEVLNILFLYQEMLPDTLKEDISL
ncbi:MAG: hypothetical protein P8I94_11325 [Emcibacteraceae bacterium]|nr:hypothetical protein [Emcibacteraceae bacterium]